MIDRKERESSGEEAVGNRQPGAFDLEALFKNYKIWPRWLDRADYPRLATAISSRQKELDALPRDSLEQKAPAAEDGFCSLAQSYDRCTAYLALAQVAFDRRHADSAWEFLNAFDREYLIFRPAQERAALWVSAREEAAKKLSSHRKAAVEKLLEEPGPSPGLHRLRQALFHLQEASSNKFRKIAALRSQFVIVSGYLVVIVFAMLLYSAGHGFDLTGEDRLSDVLPAATLSGLLGGVLSLAYSILRFDSSRRVPEITAAFLTGLVRPLVGAAIALPVAFFFESGLLQGPEGKGVWVLLAFCFLGGFSERWFLGVVGKAEKR